MTTPEVFEPADPARAMPKWLIFAAIAALIVFALLYNWLSNRAVEPEEQVAVNNVAAAPLTVPPASAASQAQGPVVLTATDRVWIEVKDGGVVLKQGELAAGDTFQVPPDAAEPTLTTAKSEALRITVGSSVAPAVGPPAEKVTVSLKPADLLQPRPAAATPTRPTATPPATATRAEPPAAEPATNATVPAQPSQQ
jgi:cytoskeleton protein RodZ